MKHLFRTAASMLAAVLLMSLLLAGCGDSVSMKDDAENYVKAVLDLMCTGECDSSVTFGDDESEKEAVSRDAMVADVVGTIAKDNDLSEEQSAEFEALVTQALSSCRYSIKGVKETDDGGCDVTVSIEPLKLFEGVSDALVKETDKISEDIETAITMDEEDQRAALTAVLVSQISKNLEDPQYAAAEEVVVHYGLLEGTEDRYGIDQNAGKLLGEKLFSSEGL